MSEDVFVGGRLSEAAFLILVSLAGGPKHGYSMMEDICTFAGVRMGASMLYPTLTRLEERGLVEALPAIDRRRPYRLTSAGQTVLQAHLSSLDARVVIGRQRLATALTSWAAGECRDSRMGCADGDDGRWASH